MIESHWYLLTVSVLVLIASVWATFSDSTIHTAKERFHCMSSTAINCVISAIAYWMLVFILSLVIAAGIWLFLLLLVWVPSDFFQNYFGADVFANALQNIKPAIYKSASSPGITHIPLLDYISLSAAYLLAPLLGIWSILKQSHLSSSDGSPQPQS